MTARTLALALGCEPEDIFPPPADNLLEAAPVLIDRDALLDLAERAGVLEVLPEEGSG